MDRSQKVLLWGVVIFFSITACQFVTDIVSDAINGNVPVGTPALPPPNGEDSDADISASAPETLKTLQNTDVPINDPEDLARRLQGIVVDSQPPTSAAPLRVGAQNTFFVTNNDPVYTSQVDATLQYITPHVYFWIQDDVDFSPGDLIKLTETFESEIYVTTRSFFGTEWLPGIDGDEHIYILFARGLGSTVAGYFSSVDSLDPLIRDDSNGHEMFVLSAANLALSDDYTYSVLAHEFQHMIHWNLDRNETSWINEGFSEVAQLLNGYSTGGKDFLFARNPDHQLNTWPNDHNTSAYYGASFLFLTYFLDRFGESATQALVAHPADGMSSVDLVLESLAITDPVSNKPITADDLVLDWVITNYVQDDSVSDGRYDYEIYADPPFILETESDSRCNSGPQMRDVHQYGADYIKLDCRQPINLRFVGETSTTLLPESAYSGDYAFFSNKGDTSDMTLTQEFDFSAHTGPLTLDFWTWYDIETDWDYVYLEASLDGQNWEILDTPSGIGTNPSGNNYGVGYSGLSNEGPEWMLESVDISQYAGQKVQLRFEYVTDAAVNGEGLLIDDISIHEIDYFTDFETDDGGWEAAGFVRVQNILPQSFRLAIITFGEDTKVETIQLDSANRADIPLQFGGDVDEAVLVVLATTRFTRQLADYSFEIIRE